MFTQFHKRKRGFSLLEMVIVIIIIGLIYSFAAPKFSRYNLRKKLEFEADKVAKVIEMTRSETTANRASMKAVFDSSNETYYYLNATSSGPENRRDKLNHLDTSTQFDSAPAELAFKINGGIDGASAPVVITLRTRGREKIDVTVNHRTGRVTVGEIY